VSVLAIDPGAENSALLHWDGERILLAVIEPNEAILKRLEEFPTDEAVTLAIEKVESYGTIVGETVFETVFWSGRFAQVFGFEDVKRIGRGAVKMHICGTKRAGDSDIRTMLIQKFGGTVKAIGKKKSPGPLYEITTHLWAALALAITYYETAQPAKHADLRQLEKENPLTDTALNGW
jgi:hypothetical protein